MRLAFLRCHLFQYIQILPPTPTMAKMSSTILKSLIVRFPFKQVLCKIEKRGGYDHRG